MDIAELAVSFAVQDVKAVRVFNCLRLRHHHHHLHLAARRLFADGKLKVLPALKLVRLANAAAR